MKVFAINNINVNFYGNKVLPVHNALPVKSAPTNLSLPDALNGKTKFYVDNVNKLRNETKEFPNDVEYRKTLLKNAGMNPNEYYKIRSIIGPDEIQSVMKQYDNDGNLYSVGVNDENIKSGLLRANLHIHTQASDGRLSVEELLDKAADYANLAAKKQPQFKKQPFTIAITDHDTTESAQKAIKIIAENPLKYKNLRVILGTEVTTYNKIAPNLVSEPTNTHVLAYGIDPNEKIYKNFIEGTKNRKNELEKRMINDANELGKNIFVLNEAKEFSNFLDKKLIGICNHMASYLKTKYVLSEIVCKNDEIKSLLKQKNMPTEPKTLIKELDEYLQERYNRNKPINPKTELVDFIKDDRFGEILTKEYENPQHKEFLQKIDEINQSYYTKMDGSEKFHAMPKFEDLYNGLKGQKNAIIGLAHPLKPTWNLNSADDKLTFLKDFYSKFKSAFKEKAKFSEVYYQSYKQTAEQPVQTFLNQISKALKLFRTGSADSHGKNIFKRF